MDNQQETKLFINKTKFVLIKVGSSETTRKAPLLSLHKKDENIVQPLLKDNDLCII